MENCVNCEILLEKLTKEEIAAFDAEFTVVEREKDIKGLTTFAEIKSEREKFLESQLESFRQNTEILQQNIDKELRKKEKRQALLNQFSQGQTDQGLLVSYNRFSDESGSISIEAPLENLAIEAPEEKMDLSGRFGNIPNKNLRKIRKKN